MKKTVRILAVVMVIAMLALTLVACAKTLKGKYTGTILGIETTYEFDGKNVTRTTGIGGYAKTEEGTYEIVESTEEEGKLIIIFTFGDDTDSKTFSEVERDGEKYIALDGFEYKKVK